MTPSGRDVCAKDKDIRVVVISGADNFMGSVAHFYFGHGAHAFRHAMLNEVGNLAMRFLNPLAIGRIIIGRGHDHHVAGKRRRERNDMEYSEFGIEVLCYLARRFERRQ